MKIPTILALIVGCFPLFAQSISKSQPPSPQLHVIFCTDQRDVEFGRINMENDTLMNGFVNSIRWTANYPMQIRRLDPANFTSKALRDTIAALKTSPQDMIILYYSGYGIAPANPAETFANWRLDKENKTGLAVNEVENWLRAKNVRLGLLIADCSTQRIDQKPIVLSALTTLGISMSTQVIQKLFLRTKGIIKLGSSTPSTPGYINLFGWPKLYSGTVFTNALCQTLNSLVMTASPSYLPYISIESLWGGTEYAIKNMLGDSPYSQTTVFEIKNWDGSVSVRKRDFANVIPAGARWQGLTINEYDYETLQQKWLPQPIKRLPNRTDLSKYAPPVIDQGDKGICVAVSVGYYMRSILEAKRLGITNKDEILKHSYSPFYLYNTLKWENDRKCTFGIDAGAALDYIKQYGLPPFSAFPDPNSCERHRHASTRIDSSSRIEDYAKLFNITDPKDAKVLAAKQALAEGAPIVVGIETTGSMANLSFEKTLVPRLKSFVSELLDKEVSSEPMMAWEPYQANSLEFGHAMCVVGYDDKMLGKGAFKLINSWGSSWGDKGYFWMSYDTFGKFAKYGYQAFLPPATATSGNLLDTDLKIMTDVFTDKGVPFTTISTNNGLMTYALTEPQRTGTSFKFKIDVKKQTYLYLITASESDSTVTKLLPLPGYKMVVAPGNRLIYPSADLNLKLSGISGQEYWLFLLSATPLDIDHYIQLLNRRLSRFTVIQDDSSAEQYVQKPISLKSPFPDRVANIFRKDLVPTELIRYKRKKMGFFVQNDPKAHGRVVPLLVTMSHVP